MTTPNFSRQALAEIAAFLPIFGAAGFEFGTWVMRQGSFPYVSYHSEVARFVRVLERYGWVHESPEFLWGPWLRTPEARKLMNGELLGRATPEQLARLMTVFCRQERIVDGARLDLYNSGVLLGALTRIRELLSRASTIGPHGELLSDAEVQHLVQTHPALAAEPADAEAPAAQPDLPSPPNIPHPSSSLTFSEASARVHAFISQFEEGYFPPLLMLARLTEEVGEVARVIAHQNGKKPKAGEPEGDLELELADLLFVMVCMANERGLNLERGFDRMMTKIEERDAQRWTRKAVQGEPDHLASAPVHITPDTVQGELAHPVSESVEGRTVASKLSTSLPDFLQVDRGSPQTAQALPFLDLPEPATSPVTPVSPASQGEDTLPSAEAFDFMLDSLIPDTEEAEAQAPTDRATTDSAPTDSATIGSAATGETPPNLRPPKRKGRR